MPEYCDFCGKLIWKGEEFVLAGKYPSMLKTWFRSSIVRWAPPDSYGKIYHKECFFTKHQILEKIGKRKSKKTKAVTK